MNQKIFNVLLVIILIAIAFSGIFLIANYFHYKSIKNPSFLYYTNLLYWENGDHRTHIYSYNPNTNQEKEILILPTTVNISLRKPKQI